MEGNLVFLTGASGFLGRHVALALAESGYEVRCLVRTEAAEARLPAGCEPARGDLRRPGELVPLLRGCRYLVHAAALYSFSPRDREMISRVNVTGTAGLLEAARRAGVEKGVVTSSSATVGPARGGRPATEESTAGSGHGASGYHESKLAQERVARAARLPTVLVLPTMPVGAGDRRPTPTGRMVLDAMRGRIPAYLPGGANLVAVEDAARAHVLALQRGAAGVRYLVGGENLSLREILSMVAEAAGRHGPRFRMPYAAALALGWADEGRCRAGMGKRPVVPLEGVRMGRELMHVSCAKAFAELGYRPRVAAREAVRRAVAWYREEGMAA
ncbi:MAG: NAD-dependent epimerase/dehydratase family protein [Candidatus Dormibacterales bacterium]